MVLFIYDVAGKYSTASIAFMTNNMYAYYTPFPFSLPVIKICIYKDKSGMAYIFSPYKFNFSYC